MFRGSHGQNRSDKSHVRNTVFIKYIPKPAMTVSIRPAPAAIRRVSATYLHMQAKIRRDSEAGMPLLLAYLPTLLHMYIRASQELIDNTPYF